MEINPFLFSNRTFPSLTGLDPQVDVCFHGIESFSIKTVLATGNLGRHVLGLGERRISLWRMQKRVSSFLIAQEERNNN